MSILTTLIVTVGLLAPAAPASAVAAFPDVCIVYNGHAGLGLNVSASR
jgi:hypothetical protein